MASPYLEIDSSHVTLDELLVVLRDALHEQADHVGLREPVDNRRVIRRHREPTPFVADDQTVEQHAVKLVRHELRKDLVLAKPCKDDACFAVPPLLHADEHSELAELPTGPGGHLEVLECRGLGFLEVARVLGSELA